MSEGLFSFLYIWLKFRQMAKAKKLQEYNVIKTFADPKGQLKRVGESVTFPNKKDEAHMVALGYVEPATTAKPKRTTKSEKTKEAKSGQA